MDDNFWSWAKTVREAEDQRKTYIKYGLASIPITILVLIAYWPIGLFCIIATVSFFLMPIPNYIHQKLVLEKRETNL